jgi:hypothetical protein
LLIQSPLALRVPGAARSGGADGSGRLFAESMGQPLLDLKVAA